jgi:hypothetical protein
MTSDDVLQLQQPLTAGGIRSVNFFNGRLLTSRDLTREQEARSEAIARLGLALGEGVVLGLDVARDVDRDTAAAPVLRVMAGMAVNRLGRVLTLLDDASVALTRLFADGSTTVPCDCQFAKCNPLADGVYVVGAGVYVLTMAPAQVGEGRAATNGLDPTGVRCNTDAVVEGVQFRLIAVNPLRYADLDISSAQFRNQLAYRCFGAAAQAAAAADPWQGEPVSHGLIDDLRMGGDQRLGAIGDADVPLAILYWTTAGLRFVDNWAVRRQLEVAQPGAGVPSFARRRRLSEAHAMCEQFRQQLTDLLAASTNPAGVLVRDHFRYLPPFGLLPLQRPGQRGFIEKIFLTGVGRPPQAAVNQSTPFIDARLLGALQELALTAPPTDLETEEFVRVYRPWQTVQAADSNPRLQQLLVFSSGLLPDMGAARFDMARWDCSNHVACCVAT